MRLMIFCLLWEQEVGGSNPLAPTSLRLERSVKRRLPRRSSFRAKAGPPLLNHNSFQATARQAISSIQHLKRLGGMKIYYTYILQSQKSPERFYIGFTEHLESRLKSHNRGENPYTSK